MGDLAPQSTTRWRVFRADSQLQIVLLVWAFCWSSFAVYLHHFRVPLPWADEWEITPVAAGKEPVTLEWLFQAQNEHRTPLTRLQVLIFGRLDSWDLQVLRYVNLALLALGSLSLILAARAVRGETAWSDAFLCLLVLTPWQFESLLCYGFSYALALALMCLAISAVMTGWPMRKLVNWWLFVVVGLMITFSGGPAGNLWAFGLCGLALRCWVERPSRIWRANCLAGTALVAAASGAMIWSIPHSDFTAPYRADSAVTAIRATAKVLLCWVGEPVQTLGVWGLGIVLIPGLYVAARALIDLWRLRRQGLRPGTGCGQWVDLIVVLLGTLAVAGSIGYSRGKFDGIWMVPHYCVLLIPVMAILYQLLVRLRAPAMIPGILAVVAAGLVGWNWSAAIWHGRTWSQSARVMWRALRHGQEPLSEAARKYYRNVGFRDSEDLLNFLLQLRDAHLSVFRPGRQREPVAGLGLPQVWTAAAGQLSGNGRRVAEKSLWINSQPAEKIAVESVATADTPATISYEVTSPADGTYALCCRLCSPSPGQILNVQVDGGPVITKSLPVASEYYPCHLDSALPLRAGQHTLTVSFPKPGTKLDLVELIPQSKTR